MGFCEVCGELAPLRCSVCKVTTYCSPDCQNEDWGRHKRVCEINKMLEEMNKRHAEEPKPRPVDTHCTGCGLKFRRDYESDQLCEDCGYTTCESCSCSHSKGSCYCLNSNFGNPYCEREPAWYHGGRGKSYQGDRHPEELDPEVYEEAERKCGNCGKMARMLKKEYC